MERRLRFTRIQTRRERFRRPILHSRRRRKLFLGAREIHRGDRRAEPRAGGNRRRHPDLSPRSRPRRRKHRKISRAEETRAPAIAPAILAPDANHFIARHTFPPEFPSLIL